MSEVYFLSRLKPIVPDKTLPSTAADFLKDAFGALDETLWADLQKLALISPLQNLPAFLPTLPPELWLLWEHGQKSGLKASEILFRDQLWRLYYDLLMTECRSGFIRSFAQNALALTEALAGLFSQEAPVFLEPLPKKTIHTDDPVVFENWLHRYHLHLIYRLEPFDPWHSDHIYAHFLQLVFWERHLSPSFEKGYKMVEELMEKHRSAALV